MPDALLAALPIPLFEYKHRPQIQDESSPVATSASISLWIIATLLLAMLLLAIVFLGLGALLTLGLTLVSLSLTTALVRFTMSLPLANRRVRIALSTLLTVSPVAVICIYVMFAGSYFGLFTLSTQPMFAAVVLLVPPLAAMLLPLSQALLLHPKLGKEKRFESALAFSVDHAGWIIGVILVSEIMLRLPATGTQLQISLSQGLLRDGLLTLLLFFCMASIFSIRAKVIRQVYSLPEPEKHPEIKPSKLIIASTLVVAIVVVLGIVALLLLPSIATNSISIYDLPSDAHQLGTDRFGRDLLTVSLLHVTILIVGSTVIAAIISAFDRFFYNEQSIVVYLDVIWMAFQYALLLSVLLPSQQFYLGLWSNYEDLLAGVLVPSGGFFYRIAGWYLLLTFGAGVLIYLPYALAATTASE